ncbi:MAG: sulfotransferase [Mycobacteriales bacterium]
MTAHGSQPAAPHRKLSWLRATQLGLVGVASDVRDRRSGRHGSRAQASARSGRALQRLAPRVRRPIFIVGAPRSGTTFLGGCIGRLPTVSYHFEPRLTKAAARCVYDGSWSQAKASRVFRANYGALLLAGGDGGLRFAEKNPENCFIVPFLMRTFPDAVFVHIVRDGRDATVSHAEKPWLAAKSAASGQRGRGGTAWGPEPRFWVEANRHEEFRAVSDIERSAWCWRRFTEAAFAGLAGLPDDKLLRLGYEDLVADPSPFADTIGEFLDIPAGAARDPLRSGLAEASPSSVGRWRESLSAHDADAVQRQCGPLLAELGYTR